jgi:hypothetical protein
MPSKARLFTLLALLRLRICANLAPHTNFLLNTSTHPFTGHITGRFVSIMRIEVALRGGKLISTALYAKTHYAADNAGRIMMHRA